MATGNPAFAKLVRKSKTGVVGTQGLAAFLPTPGVGELQGPSESPSDLAPGEVEVLPPQRGSSQPTHSQLAAATEEIRHLFSYPFSVGSASSLSSEVNVTQAMDTALDGSPQEATLFSQRMAALESGMNDVRHLLSSLNQRMEGMTPNAGQLFQMSPNSASQPRRFAKLNLQAQKSDIHAVKTLFKVVTAVTRTVGLNGSETEKAEAVSGLLRLANELAETLAASCNLEGGEVAPWLKGAAMNQAVDFVSSSWEELWSKERPASISDHLLKTSSYCGRHVEGVIEVIHPLEGGLSPAEVRQMFDVITLGSRYIEADTEELAKAKIISSCHSVAWDLYNVLTQAKYAAFFANSDVSQVVDKILSACIVSARSAPLETVSMDLRTAHMQGGIRRMSELVLAKYCANIDKHLSQNKHRVEGNILSEAEQERAVALLMDESIASADRLYSIIEKVAPKMFSEPDSSNANKHAMKQNSEPVSSRPKSE